MNMIVNKLNSTDNSLNFVSISFIYKENLYNAAYIPSENITLMLEKVMKSNDFSSYHKTNDNIISVNVISRTCLKIASSSKSAVLFGEDLASAAAMASFKLGLTYSDLSVKTPDGDLNIML